MGNWRTVQIVGTCAAAEVPALGRALNPGPDYRNFHCLVNGGLFGLPNWAAEQISVIGNLAERGYDPDAVARTLTKLAAVAPSLAVKVHCGGDYEAAECVATVTLAGGVATMGPPEIAAIPDIDEDQVEAQMVHHLTRHGILP